MRSSSSGSSRRPNQPPVHARLAETQEAAPSMAVVHLHLVAIAEHHRLWLPRYGLRSRQKSSRRRLHNRRIQICAKRALHSKMKRTGVAGRGGEIVCRVCGKVISSIRFDDDILHRAAHAVTCRSPCGWIRRSPRDHGISLLIRPGNGGPSSSACWAGWAHN